MAKSTNKDKTVSRASTEIAVRPVQEVVAAPSFMKGKEGKGTEGISNTDIEMPRIKLVQGIDQELMASHDGLVAGAFFHTLAEVDLGTELDIVPLHISKRVVLWAPRPPIDAGGILARADDAVHWVPADRSFEVKIDKKGTKTTWKTAKTVAESGLLEWGTFDPSDSDSQPAATLCHVFVVALPKFPQYSPVAIMLQRSGIKPARKLLGKTKIIGGQAPIYGQVYRMTSFLDGDTGQQFNNYAFQANGFVQDEKQFALYEGLHEQFKKSGIQIKDLEEAGADDAAASGGGKASAEAPKDKSGKDKY